MQKLGDLNLGQPDVKADQFSPVIIKVNRSPTGFNLQAFRTVIFGNRRKTGRIIGPAAHDPVEQFAALVQFNGDILGTNREHITESVGGHRIGMAGKGIKVRRLEQIRKVCLEDPQPHIHPLHPETVDIVGIGHLQLPGLPLDFLILGCSVANKGVDVLGSESQPLEGDIVHPGIVIRDTLQALDSVKHHGSGISQRGIQNAFQKLDITRQAGIH